MGKKRRRSEASDAEGESSIRFSVQKKQRTDKWTFPQELDRKVGMLVGIN